MQDKPQHLTARYADQFADASVASAYFARPPYPTEVFTLLERLLPTGSRHVLELGCGTGDLTLGLTRIAERVDAVDPSSAMLEIGRTRAAVANCDIRWFESTAEGFDYGGPYALVVAAESLHWMEWSVVLPAIGAALAPGAQLAVVTKRALGHLPWDADLTELIGRYSTNREYRPYDLITELTRRDLFQESGRERTQPVTFRQSIADYIESFHSRNGFSRERMGSERAAAFDAAAAALVTPHCGLGMVEAQLFATVVWGQPTPARP